MNENITTTPNCPDFRLWNIRPRNIAACLLAVGVIFMSNRAEAYEASGYEQIKESLPRLYKSIASESTPIEEKKDYFLFIKDVSETSWKISGTNVGALAGEAYYWRAKVCLLPKEMTLSLGIKPGDYKKFREEAISNRFIDAKNLPEDTPDNMAKKTIEEQAQLREKEKKAEIEREGIARLNDRGDAFKNFSFGDNGEVILAKMVAGKVYENCNNSKLLLRTSHDVINKCITDVGGPLLSVPELERGSTLTYRQYLGKTENDTSAVFFSVFGEDNDSAGLFRIDVFFSSDIAPTDVAGKLTEQYGDLNKIVKNAGGPTRFPGLCLDVDITILSKSVEKKMIYFGFNSGIRATVDVQAANSFAEKDPNSAGQLLDGINGLLFKNKKSYQEAIKYAADDFNSKIGQPESGNGVLPDLSNKISLRQMVILSPERTKIMMDRITNLKSDKSDKAQREKEIEKKKALDL